MPIDDLSMPLGVGLSAKPGNRRLSAGRIMLGVALTLLAGFAGFVGLTHDPLGGEPVGVASIARPASTALAQTAQTQFKPDLPSAKSLAGRSSAADIEEESGVRVIRQNGATAPSAVVIRVPESLARPRLAASPDRRLVEKSRHGPLPKISADGLKPLDIYARAPDPQSRTTSARIAIVIGGLGIGQSVTSDTIARLPGEVSLAFAPYGNDLERQVQTARSAGHEVLLHLPMEPFDYPDNDPGPQTLLSSLTPTQNVDRLQWLMSRFTGYVGVVNFMGARLTSNEAAASPILKELAQRGLAYLDDGSSQRSLAVGLAISSGMPASRADVMLDAGQKSSDIDASLAKLEQIARDRGTAVGVGSALPVTIDRIQRWSKTLEAKGIVLVPLTATLAAPRT